MVWPSAGSMALIIRLPVIGWLACAVLLAACGGSTEPGGGNTNTIQMRLTPEPRVGETRGVV